jgi:hypothetical protein
MKKLDNKLLMKWQKIIHMHGQNKDYRILTEKRIFEEEIFDSHGYKYELIEYLLSMQELDLKHNILMCIEMRH